MYILSVYTLLKVVSHYDLSVLSMSVMGFQKKVRMGGWVGGWGELYPSIFWILGIFLTLKKHCIIYFYLTLRNYYIFIFLTRLLGR